MVQAMVALFPLPVMPSRVWKRSPRSTPSASPSIARGWSPAGEKSLTTLNGGTADKATRVVRHRRRPDSTEPGRRSRAQRDQAAPVRQCVAVAGPCQSVWNGPTGRRTSRRTACPGDVRPVELAWPLEGSHLAMAPSRSVGAYGRKRLPARRLAPHVGAAPVALVLASGPVAAASHRSAAALLGIPGFDRRGHVEVVTPRQRRHLDPQATVHRWRVLPNEHITMIDGIACTRVARTLVDLAGVLHPSRTERAVDNCLAMRVVTLQGLRAAFDDLAQRGRKGIATMRGILAERAGPYVPVEGELEARFRDLMGAAGLPEPVRQLDVGDSSGWIGRVDFAYPAAGLLIELDGRRNHSSKLDQEADRRRDARLAERVGGRSGSAGPTLSTAATSSSTSSATSSQAPRHEVLADLGLSGHAGPTTRQPQFGPGGPRSTSMPGRPRPPGRRARRRCG